MSEYKDALTPDQNLPVAVLLSNPGDYVVGEVHSYSTGFDTQWRDATYPIMILRLLEWVQEPPNKDQKPIEKDDLVSVHVFSSVLERELAKIDPKEGERVGIVRLETKKSKRNKKREYVQYRVKVFGRKSAGGFMAARQEAKRAEMIDREHFEETQSELGLEDGVDDDGLPF